MAEQVKALWTTDIGNDGEMQSVPDGDPVEWIERNYYIPETGRPIVLVPYQRAVLREALSINDEGKFNYATVVWSDIKKSAKSSIAAAVALWRASNTPWASVKIVANDLKQADSRVAAYMRRAINLSPVMSAQIRTSGNTTRFPNNATTEAIPIDPGGEAGGTDHLIIFSELWAAKHKAIKQMWTEMTLAPMLYGYSQRWIETYAGYEGVSVILEALYKRGMKGERLDLSFEDEDGYHDLSDLEIYRNGPLLMLWNDIPRCPWQTADYYANERITLTPDEFQRVHRNQWQADVEQFVTEEMWNACNEKPPRFPTGLVHNIALDAGVSDDTFAMVMTCEWNGRTWVRSARCWHAPTGGKIDYDEPEAALDELVQRYHVRDVRYDPYQLHHFATRFKKRARTLSMKRRPKVVEFNQGKDRLLADKQLYDRIKVRNVAHFGQDDLSEHVLNSRAKKTDERKLRIVKGDDQTRKVDLAVALSMCIYREDWKPDADHERYIKLMAENVGGSKWR